MSMERAREWLDAAAIALDNDGDMPRAQAAAQIGLLAAVVDHDESEDTIERLDQRNTDMDTLLGQIMELTEGWKRPIRTMAGHPATPEQLAAKHAERVCAAEVLALVNGAES